MEEVLLRCRAPQPIKTSGVAPAAAREQGSLAACGSIFDVKVQNTWNITETHS